MDNKQFKALAESIAGVIACQSVLFQLLVKDGVIKKEEVGLILDGIIEGFNKQHPNNVITKPIKDLRESINKISPYQYPDWLRDIIGGENQDKT